MPRLVGPGGAYAVLPGYALPICKSGLPRCNGFSLDQLDAAFAKSKTGTVSPSTKKDRETKIHVTERVRIVIRCNSYSKTTTEGVAIERERESTLTVYHSCHRTRIPFGHVLIERSCGQKHCKRQKIKTNKKQNV